MSSSELARRKEQIGKNSGRSPPSASREYFQFVASQPASLPSSLSPALRPLSSCKMAEANPVVDLIKANASFENLLGSRFVFGRLF